MQIVSLITAAFDLRLNGLGIFVELLLQLQQFKAASSARFPTATQKRALPRVGDPLRAGLFLKWLTETPISALADGSETRLASTARLVTSR